VQQSPRSYILAAPKVTLFQRQSLEVEGLHSELANLLLHGKISEDRREIELKTAWNCETPGDVIAGTITTRLKDGHALLLNPDLITVTQARMTNEAPPIVSKVPYINRLFKNTGIGRESSRVVILVTPRVIVVEEEEELLGIP
jgi:hypothetical protein